MTTTVASREKVSETEARVAIGLLSWLIDVVSQFREQMDEYWATPSIIDALRYTDGEAREARDIWMRENLNHARNNERDWDFEHEVADMLIMGATALNGLDSWEPPDPKERSGYGYDPDDICTMTTEAVDFYRWREIYAPVFEDAWIGATERAMIGSMRAIGMENVKTVVKDKLRYLVYGHVPQNEIRDVTKELVWIYGADDDEIAF